MKLPATVARYLLGTLFTIFGLNGFFHFIHQPPPAAPLAVEYMTVLFVSHYFVLVFALQSAAGILLLSNRFVPLALTILAPILVNILLFHSLLDPSGIGAGIVATILWGIIFFDVRAAFQPLFAAAPARASVS